MTESSCTVPAEDAAYFDAFPDLFDRFTRIWDGISSSFDDWILAHLPQRVASAVDLGCGAGRHSILLADHADDVLAVDVADRMLDIARLNGPGPTSTTSVAASWT